MKDCFIPECYFDTVLLKTILQTKALDNHQKGCNNVMNLMEKGRLKDSFAVGIVDRDKAELNYLGEFDKYDYDSLIIHKHKQKPQFVIQLNPPLEKWILQVADEAGMNVENYGLPNDFGRLQKFTKSELAEETVELRNLCKALLKSNSETIKRLSAWLLYLKENTYQADINKLLNG